ncbi:MAG: DUF2911 domain-containing protein [Bacteroidia bacterium]|nr:DUF2911 domain-containing protein [Bacteroidia bacterium]
MFFPALTLESFSQMNLPDLSPQGKVLQTIGYTNVTIRYGRPAARGRKVFGELVPYGKLWRAFMRSFQFPVKSNGQYY